MSALHRIPTHHWVEALVAPDSFPAIAERITRIAQVGRTLTIAHRYATYTGHPPELHAGLTVAQVRVNTDNHSLWVECTKGDDFGIGVGLGIRDEWLAATEATAWEHYHRGRHEADAFSERRRDLTWVQITGGRERDDPRDDDVIVIRTYNRDGVCDERVVAFGPGVAQ